MPVCFTLPRSTLSDLLIVAGQDCPAPIHFSHFSSANCANCGNVQRIEFSQYAQFSLLDSDLEKTWVDLPPSRRSTRSRHVHKRFAQPARTHQHVKQGLRLARVKPLCERTTAYILA